MIRATIISSIWLLLLFIYYMSVGGAVALSLLILSVVFFLYNIWSLHRTAKTITCSVSGERTAMKHDKIAISVTLQGGHKLKALTAKVHLSVTHIATKTEQLHVVEAAINDRIIVLPIELQLHHCGQYEIAVKKIELFDMWKLFRKQVQKTSIGHILVTPIDTQTANMSNILLQQQGQSASVTQRMHDDGEERAQLKLYSPGDQVKKIHWKLSSKLDELYVQQFSEPQNRELVISIDGAAIQGDMDVYDHLLEKTAALLKLVLQGERVKFVHVQQQLLITNEQEITEALQYILQLTGEQLTLPQIERQRIQEQYPNVYIVTQENSRAAKLDEGVRSEGA